ncbi:MAG: F0F1 ATP synthase subunit gamma, partial [Armatimonadota bacterium]
MPLTERKIRRKIRTVANIQQITKAMRMVAAARLRRVQQRMESGRVYSEKLDEVVHRVARAAGDVSHPLLEVRPIQTSCVVLVGADKGLCGSYNVNVNRTGADLISQLTRDGQRVIVITIGRKARAFLRHRRVEPAYHFSQITGQSDVSEALAVSRQVRWLYEQRHVDRVQVVYTRFISTIRHVASVADLLPVVTAAADGDEAAGPADYIFEPAPEKLFAAL